MNERKFFKSLLNVKMTESAKEMKSAFVSPLGWAIIGLLLMTCYSYYKIYHVRDLTFFYFIGFLAGSLIPVVLPLFKKYKVAFHYFFANYLVFIFYTCITIFAFYSGGMKSNSIWWLVTIPLLASFLLNSFYSMIWSLLIFFDFILILSLGNQHLLPVSVIGNQHLLPVSVIGNSPFEGRIVISFLTNLLFISVLCVLTELIRDKTFIEKEELRLNAFHFSQIASVGKLASGVAHEINNPLTIIKAYHQRIIRMIKNNNELDKVILEDYLEKIQKSVVRIQEVTGLMRTISEQGAERNISKFAIQDLLRAVIQMLNEDLLRASVVVETSFIEKDIEFEGIYTDLFQAFFNIIENSIRELTDGIDKRVITIKLLHDDKNITVLINNNNRKNILPKNRDSFFDPFFISKLTGMANGLGLSFSLNIFVSNGGNLILLDNNEHGVVFKATLPFIQMFDS
jgi:signal transduction histidine kinase